MDSTIRPMMERDRQEVLQMMEIFYASDAVSTNGSPEIFQANFDACLGDCPYLEGYVFEAGQTIQGYSMVAKSYATEFGKPCIWIEDLYLKPEHRSLGIGSNFLRYIGEKYPQALLRLEVEEENERAVQVYEKCGFSFLPYMEMKK